MKIPRWMWLEQCIHPAKHVRDQTRVEATDSALNTPANILLTANPLELVG